MSTVQNSSDPLIISDGMFSSMKDFANWLEEEQARDDYYANGVKLIGGDATAAELMFDGDFFLSQEKALAQAKSYAAGDTVYFAELSEAINRLYGKNIERRESEISNLQIELPDDSELLDEDKTFDEQSEAVQEGLRKLGVGQLSPELVAEREAIREEQLALYEAVYGEDEFLKTHAWFRPDIFEKDGATPEAVSRYEQLSKREQEINDLENQAKNVCFVKARHLYAELIEKYGTSHAADNALDAAGIKGIIYDSEIREKSFIIFTNNNIKPIQEFYHKKKSTVYSSENNPIHHKRTFKQQGERLMTKTKEKKNIVQSLADAMAAKLIEKLETGVPPWKKDWDSTGVGLFPMPYNPLTEKTYRGGNLFWLAMQDYDDPRWMTYNQAQSLGAQVKQGEKATQIVYWKTSEMQPKLDEEGNPLLGEDGKIIKQKVWLERPHAFPAYVFNAQQIEGLPPLSQEETRQYQWDPLKKAEEILSSSNAVIEHRRQNRAYYNHTLDKIVLPVKEQFPEAAGYYSTALHELSHWTGHEDRLNRDMAHPFGSEEYAKEELRAELASAVLCWEIGVPNQNLDNSAAYLQGWIKALKDDPKEILRAASAAEKIRAYVMDFVQEQKQEIAHSETIQDAVATPAVEAKHYRYYQPEHTYDGAEVRQEVFAFTDLSEKEKLDAIIYMQEESMFVEELDSVAPEEIPLESAQAVAASHDLLFSRNGIGFLKDECVAEEVLSQTKERNFQVSRQYLNVPFGEKEEAKQAGARWDRAEKAWFVPEGMNVEKFSRWIKKEECEQEKNIRPVSDRQYLYVPFKEKNEAKAAGAKWDPKEKCWYAPEGVDKNLLTRWMPENVKLEQSPAMTPQEEFAEALRSMGCVISGDHPIMDGKTHRIGTEEDRNGEKAGFYVAHLDGRPAGYIKNNRTDEELRWKYTGQDISAEVLQQVKADYHKRMEEKQAEIDAMQQEASLRCEAKFLALDRFQENESTLYMKAKDITAYTYESAPKIINKNTLCVPLTDTEGKIWSLQYIQEDGTKRFAKGSRKEGCYHAIYGEGGLKAAPAIVIAEGFATAATLAKTLGTATVATFTASNLESVAKALHEKDPDKPIVVAGDDDKHLAKNIGREKAEKAAEAVGGKAVFPTFALEESGRNFTDWNDLAVKSKLGYNGVRLQMLPVIDELVKRKQQEHQNDKEQQQGKSRSMNR